MCVGELRDGHSPAHSHYSGAARHNKHFEDPCQQEIATLLDQMAKALSAFKVPGFKAQERRLMGAAGKIKHICRCVCCWWRRWRRRVYSLFLMQIQSWTLATLHGSWLGQIAEIFYPPSCQTSSRQRFQLPEGDYFKDAYIHMNKVTSCID